MLTKMTWLARVIVIVALGLTSGGAPLAQTKTTVDVRKFEVIAVDGNKLIVRDQKGTNQYTVPNDFRFTVDGKKMPVSELKAGMKGTATVTTTTTIKPVVVTEVREVEVVRATHESLTVRAADGTVNRFTRGQLDEKGLQIMKDGRPVQLTELKAGDRLAATIVTNEAPIVLTEKEVQLALADAKAASAPTQVATAAGAAQTPAPAPAASPQPSDVKSASPAAEPSGLGSMWYVLIAILVAVVLFVVVRRRKAP